MESQISLQTDAWESVGCDRLLPGLRIKSKALVAVGNGKSTGKGGKLPVIPLGPSRVLWYDRLRYESAICRSVDALRMLPAEVRR